MYSVICQHTLFQGTLQSKVYDETVPTMRKHCVWKERNTQYITKAFKPWQILYIHYVEYAIILTIQYLRAKYPACYSSSTLHVRFPVASASVSVTRSSGPISPNHSRGSAWQRTALAVISANERTTPETVTGKCDALNAKKTKAADGAR